VTMAQGALDRLEAEALRHWATPDARLMELVAEVRRELEALTQRAPAVPVIAVVATPTIEVAAA
jgi:hypothetical protein